MNPLAARLPELSEACWSRGRDLPRLAMKKLFECDGGAYAGWDHSLPGHEPPIPSLRRPSRRRMAGQQRDALQREMVALQEETDWLVYIAYRLAGERDGVDRSR